MKRPSNQSASLKMPSRVFKDNLSILLDELTLSIKWGRPSILLAVHRSKPGLDKAKFALQQELANISIDVVHVQLQTIPTDVIHWMEEHPQDGQTVFFVETISAQDDSYRALNLFREVLVEQSLRVVFWLTNKEAVELPRQAPDFWAFRHRVIEFSSTRKSDVGAPAAGLLMWNAGLQLRDLEAVEARIQFHVDLLKQVPAEGMMRLQHAELTLELAHLYWLVGRIESAESALDGIFQPVDAAYDTLMRTRLLNAFAIVRYSQGRYEDAVQLLEQALALDEIREIIWANLGLAHYAAGRKSQAFGLLKKSLQASHESAWLWLMNGYLQALAGKFDPAVISLERSVTLDDTNFYALCGLGYCHAKMFRTKELEAVVELIERHFAEDIVFAACRDVLSGNVPFGLERLKNRISTARLDWDPALNLLFGRDRLQTLMS